MPRSKSECTTGVVRDARGAGTAGERPTRKAYSRPVLQCYGKLVDVTLFGGSQFVDSGSLGNQP